MTLDPALSDTRLAEIAMERLQRQRARIVGGIQHAHPNKVRIDQIGAKQQFAVFWTAAKDARLKDLYLTMTHENIAVEIGSTVRAVRSRCSVLGLRKTRPQWTKAERALLVQWYKSRVGRPLHIDIIARQMERTRSEVSLMAGKLGLTSRTRPKPEGFGVGCAERSAALWKARPHPRGMLGKLHTPETRKRLSEHQRANPRSFSDAERQASSDRMVAAHASGRLVGSSNAYSRCRSGRRADLNGQFFRSAWEANYARYLNWLQGRGVIIGWKYEADTFWFEAIRRGVRSYTPDFKVTDHDGSIHYDEVKGWMDAKSKTKIARMKKYHRSVDLRVIDAKAYREITVKVGCGLPGWEMP